MESQFNFKNKPFLLGIDYLNKKDLDDNIKRYLRYIFSTCSDMEILRELMNRIYLDFNEENKDYFNTFDTLGVLGATFYFHLSIINKLLQKIKKIDKSLDVSFGYVDYFRKIEIIRNNILIHKDKPDYLEANFSMYSTSSPEYIFESNLQVLDSKTGKLIDYDIRPLEDLYKMYEVLEKLKQLVLSKK